MGSGGVVGLDDSAICNAMDRYYQVEPEERLHFSIGVRRFAAMVLKRIMERTKNGNSRTNRRVKR